MLRNPSNCYDIWVFRPLRHMLRGDAPSPRSNMIYPSYVICTSPRSGSTLLCKLLAATGAVGYPDSHFHTPSLDRWLEVYGLSAHDYISDRARLRAVFEAARNKGRGDTGVFGLRLQRGSFDYFVHQARVLYPDEATESGVFDAAFGRTCFIHLSRASKLDQAISFVKASQTGLWHMAPDGTEIERLSAPAEPRYSANDIANKMVEFEGFERAWGAWFDRQCIRPLKLSYDDLSANLTSTLAEVLAALGQDSARSQGVALPVAKLSDMTNRAWAERFLKERGAGHPV